MKRLLFATLLCANLAAAQTSTVAAAAQPPTPPANKENTVIVVIETSMGPITAELYADKAPITVANFLSYADEHFYDGTIFHRVIPGFMIQGGGFVPPMTQKPTKAPIKNEADNGLKNERGTLAMARTMVVDSATSQFFINQGENNSSLNFRSKNAGGYGYAVFGKVIDGMDIVDKIASVPTGNFGPYGDVPRTPVIIQSIHRKAPAAAAAPAPTK